MLWNLKMLWVIADSERVQMVSSDEKYRDVLNDFGWNILSSKSYRLKDRGKSKVLKIVGL